jgi:hypothetical protein
LWIWKPLSTKEEESDRNPAAKVDTTPASHPMLASQDPRDVANELWKYLFHDEEMPATPNYPWPDDDPRYKRGRELWRFIIPDTMDVDSRKSRTNKES